MSVAPLLFLGCSLFDAEKKTSRRDGNPRDVMEAEVLEPLSGWPKLKVTPRDGLLIDAAGTAHFKLLIAGRSGAMTTLASLLRSVPKGHFVPPELFNEKGGWKSLRTRMHAPLGSRVRGRKVQLSLSAHAGSKFLEASETEKQEVYNMVSGVLLVGEPKDFTTLAGLWETDRFLLPSLGKYTPVVLCLSGSEPLDEDVPEELTVIRDDCQAQPKRAFEKLLSELGIEEETEGPE